MDLPVQEPSGAGTYCSSREAIIRPLTCVSHSIGADYLIDL